MVKLVITNRSAFDLQVRTWIAAVRQQAAHVARGLAVELLNVILYKGPQYSGDFVSNWNVSVGAPNYSFNKLNESVRYMKVSKEGDMRAIAAAKSRVYFGEIKLGQVIWLANASSHDESYAVLIEENKIEFRPENPSGGRVVARAIQVVGTRYSRINKEDAMKLSRTWV